MPKLTRLKINEVSFCKDGMNQHAKVALFKSADGKMSAPPIAKATFTEALSAQLVSERISEVFWDAFDNQYAVREAFRCALTDELAQGGDGTEATAGFTAAMQTIAQTAATLARQAGANASNSTLESAVEQAVEKWLKQQETSVMKIENRAALKAAVAAFNPDTSPAAHVGIIKSAAATLNAEDELPADGPLAKAQQDPALAKALTEIAVLKMGSEVRKHYDGLDATAQTAFLALSESDQADAVAKANATDPVVYTCADGTPIRKSDGTAAAILAKRSDEQAAEIAKLRAKGETDTIEKRARDRYPNVALETAVTMLKTATQLGESTDAGKAVVKSLDTMQRVAIGKFQTLGSTEAPVLAGGVEKARGDFNTEVSKIMSRDSIGMADAMSKARTEHADLFAEAYPDTAAVDADA